MKPFKEAVQQNLPASLESLADLDKLRQFAAERPAWKEYPELICDIAQVERSTPSRNTPQDESA